MKLRFFLSGSLLFETESDSVPTIGSTVVIRTESYKKGMHSGSIISFPVTEEDPPQFDYTDSNGVVVNLDVNAYKILEEGPAPD